MFPSLRICWAHQLPHRRVAPSLLPLKTRFTFLPAILGPNLPVDNDLCNFLALRVKSSGLTIRNPMLTVESLFRTSHAATSYLAGALLCNKPISTQHHQIVVRPAGASSQKERHNCADTFLQALLTHLPPKVKKHLKCAGATSAWLTSIRDHFSGTELTKTK
ncbi:hypothetical protein ACHAW6_001351 [Cyclotella cf. meneghiniana]